MRDKLREGTIKAIRSGTKLDKEQQSWLLDRIKNSDELSIKLNRLESRLKVINRNLAKLELLSVADGSERSQGYIDAVKQLRKMVEDETHFD